ncbi:MAG: FRG domain-containing protein [Promethearchaeota archaeon]
MNIIKLSSFDEWELTANKLLEELQHKKRTEISSTYSNLLFRGQSCESWKLDTSLDRYISKQVAMNVYHQYLATALPAFEAYTGRKWTIESSATNWDNLGAPPGYEFMLYLRHHGFPAPLLDWSRSPYIAAFFAFQHAGREDNVAIFTFTEYYGGAKGGTIGGPTICECGSYVNSHRRHFQQQGQYTICKEKIDSTWYYCNHDKVFRLGSTTQDVLTKYLIPSSEKHKVLSKLDLMNINAFSLYENEEGLAETVAYREIMKRNL